MDGIFVVIHICGDTSRILPQLSEYDSCGFALDYKMEDIVKAKNAVGVRHLLFGNIDSSAVIHSLTAPRLDRFRQGSGRHDPSQILRGAKLALFSSGGEDGSYAPLRSRTEHVGDPTRVAVREYPSGHMFYSRPGSHATLRKIVQAMVGKH